MRTTWCHVYGQLDQTGERCDEVLLALKERAIPADISFSLESPSHVISAAKAWSRDGHIVAPNVYPSHLDPACHNANWWAYSEKECGRLLSILTDRMGELGFEQRDAINTYTPGNAFVKAAKNAGIRYLLGFCAPTFINDGHWLITHTGAPLSPYFAGDEDYRKPENPRDKPSLLISSMELRNPLTCFEHWSDGPFCPLNLVMGDRSIESGELPIETIAASEDVIRLTEMTSVPRIFHINLQYFTSNKCYDLNERMLDWLKIQEQRGRLKFVGLREYGQILKGAGGFRPQTTYWRGECMGQQVGGQPGCGVEAIVHETIDGQWQFPSGGAGPDRFFDYAGKRWDFAPFHPSGLEPVSEGYDVNVRDLDVRFRENVATISFGISVKRAGEYTFCVWDALRDLSGPFRLESNCPAITSCEVVPHPGGTGGAILVHATEGKARFELAISFGGRRMNEHSRRIRDLVALETTRVDGRIVTRLASMTPCRLKFRTGFNRQGSIAYDSICGKDFHSGTFLAEEGFSVVLDGKFSASMVRFWDVTAGDLILSVEEIASLEDDALRQTRELADRWVSDWSAPEEPLRFGREKDWPLWLVEAARRGGAEERAVTNRIVGAMGKGIIRAAYHMASDLPMGTKGRVRNVVYDRKDSFGPEEIFPIFYDYGQSYGPGVTGWNQFVSISLGLRSLEPQTAYTLVLNLYDPESRGTHVRIIGHGVNFNGDAIESAEIPLLSALPVAQGMAGRHTDDAFVSVALPCALRGSEALKITIISHSEYCVYDRLTERLGFVFLSHAWLLADRKMDGEGGPRGELPGRNFV